MLKRLTSFAGMGVLIVDDYQNNLDLLRALLVAEGLDRVYVEIDSSQVIARIVEFRPDIVLLDLHMPGIDGFELLTQIRVLAGGDYLPVIVLTADVTRLSRDRALALGAQDFLTKPFDLDEAVLRVANLLQTRKLYSAVKVTRPMESELNEVEQFATAERIDKVIRDHDFSAVYQPIVDIKHGDVVGYEGLTRFTSLEFGGPDRWFADAAVVDRGIELEMLAVSSMMGLLETTPADAFLALNVSPAAMMANEDLCPADVCPRIVVEITEHQPIEDYSSILRAMSPIKGHGARLAADDMGSGYAGFRHLILLAPDIIKIDISLISGIDSNPGQRALVAALTAFAHDVGAQVIAEGVERNEELNVLKDVGITWAQGYLLGRPAPAPVA